MAELVAPFTISGNDIAAYPNTPFQILYTNGPAAGAPDGEGFLFSGTNVFTVDQGTIFYVPILNVDDTDPVLGVFPTTPTEARRYIRKENQMGAHDVRVVIDGRHTRLGLDYVAGPVPSTSTNNIVTIGAFLAPLPPGTHTVTVTGGFFGDLIFCDISFKLYPLRVHVHHQRQRLTLAWTTTLVSRPTTCTRSSQH